MPSLSDHPRYPLTFGPSPVHPLRRLSAHLGGAEVWAGCTGSGDDPASAGPTAP